MKNQEDLQKFYDSLPDEITIGVKLSKDVYIRMYELERKENGSGLMDNERRATWGWLLETIRNVQRGVRFFYENGATEGPPSVRFLDDNGEDMDLNMITFRSYQ
tara:strand:- start:519 stop:830 length:312 start_codon:yes stop_codon:yes gene_type:complete